MTSIFCAFKFWLFWKSNSCPKIQFWQSLLLDKFEFFAPKLENIFEYFIPKKVSNDLIFVPKNLDFDVFDPKLNLQKIEKSQKIRNSGFFFLFKIRTFLKVKFLSKNCDKTFKQNLKIFLNDFIRKMYQKIELKNQIRYYSIFILIFLNFSTMQKKCFFLKLNFLTQISKF